MFRIPVFYWLVTRLNRSTAPQHIWRAQLCEICARVSAVPVSASQRSATAAALRLASSGPVALLLPCSVERAVCVDVLPFAAGASDVYSAQCSVFTIFHCSCSCSANADSQLIFCPLLLLLLLLFAVPFVSLFVRLFTPPPLLLLSTLLLFSCSSLLSSFPFFLSPLLYPPSPVSFIIHQIP